MSNRSRVLQPVGKDGEPEQPSEAATRLDDDTGVWERVALSDSNGRSPTGLLEQARSYDGLLEVLRLSALGGRIPIFVVAAVSDPAASQSAVDGLLEQAEERDIHLSVVELEPVEIKRLLRARRTSASSVPGGSVEEGSAAGEVIEETPEPLLSAGDRPSLGVATDVQVLHTPPVLHSADAVLLARHTEGLVIVAEASKTTRADLVMAVERARAARCRVLGVVLIGAKRWMPRWLERILGAVPF